MIKIGGIKSKHYFVSKIKRENNTMKNRIKRGFLFLLLALLAFGGLGLEMLLAFLIEPLIYGVGLDEFNTKQNILHWIITCAVWGCATVSLLFFAKQKMKINIFKNKKNVKIINWILCVILLVVSITVSMIDWNGLKVQKEFAYHGWLKFIFQYLYYFFETILVVLIIIFGQEAGEHFFKYSKIPYGGILTAITWGLVHCLTKGDFIIGLLSFASALMFGMVYLFSKKNIYISFPFIFLMFIL